MLTYSAAVTLYLAYVGFTEGAGSVAVADCLPPSIVTVL
jgi:hypothetical protein